ncbi:hypothetical protein P692DRAFT_20879206 [Suillus brevipes Sb2]|nr:hypothetical protein P692DRAFT_20879206 [Suillus brevipes Sb2]
MAGSNSDTDKEPPKQLPLNEEEVVVLEAYLEQWNSTSGKERNVVWGDVTKEARLKAPPMDAPLLKARKKVYHKWLQNHGETKNSKPPITIEGAVEEDRGRDWVKAGEHGMMNHYSKYLTEIVESLTEKEIEEGTEMAVQWNKQGVPPEVQANIARRKSDNILLYVAKEMFKRAGMRLFMLSAWKNEKGKLMVSSHNYNDEIGKGESFSQTSDWQTILPKWEAYARRQFDADDADDPVVKRGGKDNTYTLDMGDDGFPILPDHAEMDSDTWKAVVRAFLNWHYQDCSGKPKDPVPWKEVIPKQDELIPPPYLLHGLKIREPSRMNRHKATELLDFWYDRQQIGQDVIFEFYGWWSKANNEVKPHVSLADVWESVPTAGNAGGDGETTKKTKRKTAVCVVIPSDHTSDSDEDDDQPRAPPAKSAEKQAVWNIKGLSCPAKQQPKSTSQVAGDDSEDKFNAPDSSKAPSEEDMSDAGKNTRTMVQFT